MAFNFGNRFNGYGIRTESTEDRRARFAGVNAKSQGGLSSCKFVPTASDIAAANRTLAKLTKKSR